VGGPFHYNGDSWEFYRGEDGWPVFDNYGKINAIWGSGTDDVFFVSSYGQINHWNGSGFERMETPTTVHLVDIMGTGSDDVWAVGYDAQIGETALIHYDGSSWQLAYEGGVPEWYSNYPDQLSGLTWSLFSFIKDEVNVLSNPNGIYTTDIRRSPEADLLAFDHTGVAIEFLEGNHPHDLFILGNHEGFYHYNGSSMRSYTLPGAEYPIAMDVKGNLTVVISEDTHFNILGFIIRRM
jgi:hypothetical protein